MQEIIWETALDSVKLLPFLWIAYLLIEYVEHKKSNQLEALLRGAGKFGCLGGALLGSFPQCGFSVAASNFFTGRVITMGTLVSVFIATSDEALPVLLSYPDRMDVTLKLLGTKVILAVIIGLLTDIFIRKTQKHPSTDDIHEEICSHCKCESHGILYASLRHTLTIFLFIFLVNFVMNGLIEWIGTETLTQFFQSTSGLHPLFAVIIGLIPNCASSVVLTELFLSGTLSFGATIAGLSAGSGIGLLVLFRMNKRLRENITVLAIITLAGLVAGYLLQMIGI